MSRRNEILELARQMFAERGIQATSVRDLAEAAGILSSSLYSHFRSKEALADEILQEFLDDLLNRLRQVAATTPLPIERLRAVLRTFVGAVERDPAALSIYRQEFGYVMTLPRFAHLLEMHVEIRTIWLGAIEEAMADGSLRRDVDPVVLYRWTRDALCHIPQWRGNAGPSVTELSAYAELVFVDGMATRRADQSPGRPASAG